MIVSQNAKKLLAGLGELAQAMEQLEAMGEVTVAKGEIAALHDAAARELAAAKANAQAMKDAAEKSASEAKAAAAAEIDGAKAKAQELQNAARLESASMIRQAREEVAGLLDSAQSRKQVIDIAAAEAEAKRDAILSEVNELEQRLSLARAQVNTLLGAGNG